MAVTNLGGQQSATRTDTSDPYSLAVTVPSNCKGIFVGISHGTENTDLITSVSFDGVTFTRVVTATDDTTEPGRAYLYFGAKTSFTSGAGTISVNMASATGTDVHFNVWYAGSDITNATLRVADSDSISENAANPTVTLNKGGLSGWSVCQMYGGGAAPGGTLATGNTLAGTVDHTAFYSQGCHETTIDSSDHTIGWSTLGTDDLAFVAAVVVERTLAAAGAIATAEAFGAAHLKRILRGAPGVTSGEAFPNTHLVGGLPAQTVRPGGFGIEELLWRNPDFEQDLGAASLDVNQQVAWEAQNGATVSISTANPRSGRRHMRVVTNGSTVNEGALAGLNDLYSDSPRVVAGRRYIFSAWVYVASGVDMNFRVAFKDINSNYLGDEWNTPFTGDGTWKFVSVAGVAPAGALSAHPIIRTNEVIATTFDVDNVSMRPDVYATEVLKDSPRAWYRMHEGSGQPQDSSGNGNHTTTMGGTLVYLREGPGVVGTAVYLDGGDSARAPDHSSLDLGDVVTMEAWVRRVGNFGLENSIICKNNDDAGTTGAYALLFSTINKLAIARSYHAILVESTIAITDSNWHHVVGTKNGATMKLYIDGVDVTGTPSNQTLSDNSQQLWIGAERTPGGGGASEGHFFGDISEAAVYATALSAERVKQHYNAGLLAGKDHGTADTNRVLRARGYRDQAIQRVRSFNGTSDEIQLDATDWTVVNALTFAAIVKHDGATGWCWALSLEGGVGDGEAAVGLNNSAARKMGLWINGGGTSGTTEILANRWYLLVATKADGAGVTPRFHIYDFSTGKWVHENGTSTVSDVAALDADRKVWIGTYDGASEWWDGDIAVVGAWKSTALTDWQVEQLAQDLSAWTQLGAEHLWVLDQTSVSQAVQDRQGSSDQTAISGTSVALDTTLPFAGRKGAYQPIEFDGSSLSRLVCDLGAVSIGSGFTMVAVIRPKAAASAQQILGVENSSDQDVISMEIRDDDHLIGVIDGVEQGDFTTLTADKWYIVAYSKSSGTSAPRGHYRNLTDAGAWGHANSSSVAHPARTPAKITLGEWSNLDPALLHLAVVGIWNSVLTDAQIETLGQNLDAWEALSPSWWALANGTTPLFDESGGGGNETDRQSGVTASAQTSPLDWLDGLGTPDTNRVLRPRALPLPVAYQDGWNDQTVGGDETSNASISTTTTYEGGAALRLQATAGVAYWNKNAIGGNPNVLVMRAYVRYATLPNANVTILTAYTNGVSAAGVGYHSASGEIRTVRDGAYAASGRAIVANTWYRIDVRVDASTGTWYVDAMVDGTPITSSSGSPGGPGTFADYRLGDFSNTATWDGFWDKLAVSHDPSAYPISGPDFPWTALLDSFNRADESPLGNGTWTNQIAGSGANAAISGNGVITDNTPPAGVSAWWSARAFGADQEAYITCSADLDTAENLSVIARLKDVGTSTWDGYQVGINADGTINLGRRDDGTWIPLDSASVTVQTGDSVGIRCVGSRIEAWHKPVGGSWTLRLSVADTTYAAGGYIGFTMYTEDFTTKLDDFGGGEIDPQAFGVPDTNRVLRPRPWAFYDGFEANNLNLWTIAAGSPSIVTSPVYAGTYAVRANPTAGIVSLLRSMPAANAKATLSFRVRRASAAGETPILGTIGQNVGNPMILTQYNSGNLVLRWRDSGGTDHDLDSLTMPLDTWMHVELAVDASANPWKIRWRVDGVDRGEFTASHAAVNFDQWGVGCWGYAMTWDVYYDEVFAGLTYDYYANDMAPSMYRSGAPFADVMLEYGPASYWKLDESSGTTAVDRKGVADGTYSGPGYTLGQASLVPVDSGKSVLLDGSQGASVLLGDVYDFTGSAQFTACAWVRLGAFSVANGHFVFGNIDATARGWSLDLQTPAITIAARRGDNAGWDQAYYQVSEEFLEGSTHFLAAVYDGSNIKLFLDGSFVHSQPTSKSLVAPTTNTGLRIGSYGGGGSGWDGQLDEAAIFTYALSEAQLRAIYEAGVGAGAHKTSRVLRPEGFVHFPSTGLLDTFDRADAAGSLGSRWSSPFEPTFGSLGILSNKCYPATGFKDNYWTGAFDADQEVHVTLSTLPSAVGPIRIYARQQNHNGGSRNAYYIETQYDGAGWIGKVVAGAASGLGSGWGAGSVAAGDKIALRCIGTRITAYKFSGGAWSVLESLTDSSVTGSGTIGLQVRDDTTARFDDFGGGSVGAGAVGWHALAAAGTPEFDGTLRAVGQIATAEAWGSHKAIRILRETGIATAEAWGQPDANRVLRALGIATAEAHGTLGRVRYVIKPTGLASAEAFGVADANRLLRALGIAGQEALGQPDANRVLKPTGVATAEAFGQLAKLLRRIAPTGLVSGEAFGAHDVNRILRVIGITTAEAFGRPDANFALRPVGVAGQEAFGTLGRLRRVVYPVGLASAEGWGKPGGMPGENPIITVQAVGQIATAEAFGNDLVRFVVKALGIASQEAHGQGEINRMLRPTGAASTEAFGVADLNRRLTALGIVSAEVFGEGDLNRVLRSVAISSQEAVGSPDVNRVLASLGIASQETFADPKLRRVVFPMGVATLEAFGILRLPDYIIITEFDSVPGGVLISDEAGFTVLVCDEATFAALVSDDPLTSAIITDRRS